ncbi:MAG: discoidin domain-containing protein [Verrucomicrobiota bacterium]
MRKAVFLPVLILAAAYAAEEKVYEPDFTPQPPVKILSPEDELKTIELPEGYRLELVLSERDGIKEPANLTFDGNGRMYIAELRTYMQDIDGSNEHDPIGVVSRHESTKRDGNFDKHTLYRDKMLLPRMVLPLDDRVLINETDTLDIFVYRDTNGDGIADTKEPWFVGGPKNGNLEHQQSGLIWTMDNWIYQTYNAYRLRWNGMKEPLKETIPNGGGQWGLAQDDQGKIWWSNAGGEKGLWHFQTPILYGAFDVKGQFTEDFVQVWPKLGLADHQGGAGRTRLDKTLNHFTASCGQEVVRGDRLPADLRGDVLISEPVGRLIRRAKVTVEDGITHIANPYAQSEFIRSSDPNFRIVNMVNGPDGCLYLVDMYRGIIQEGNWVKDGSYLRKVVQQYGLDKVYGHGRVWRLVHKDFKPGPQPHMLDETPAQLVAYLSHPNGWWRDTAQKLLVLKGDKSVVPALNELALHGTDALGRTHALWTLEGLGALEAKTVRAFLADANPQLRQQGLRAGESLVRAGDKSLIEDFTKLGADKDASVVLQSIMTAKLLGSNDIKAWANSSNFIQKTLLTATSKGVKELGATILTGNEQTGGKEYTGEENKLLVKGQAIFRELCFACHGYDGKGMAIDGPKPGMTIAPPLSNSKTVRGHRDGIVRALLNGMSGPIGGKTYDAQMVPMAMNDDEWIAAVASYVRNSFGNKGAIIFPKDVARIREEVRGVATPWTNDTLQAALPKMLLGDKAWIVSASDAADTASKGCDADAKSRWETKSDQKKGMWYQVELPAAQTVAGVRLDASSRPSAFPKNFKVEGSLDGKKWFTLGTSHGLYFMSEAYFGAKPTKFVKVTLTDVTKGQPWAIQEVQLITQ